MKNSVKCWVILTIIDNEPVILEYYKNYFKAVWYLFCVKFTTKEKEFWIEKRNLPKWLDKVIEM